MRSWEATLRPWRKPYGKHATVPIQLARQFSTLPEFVPGIHPLSPEFTELRDQSYWAVVSPEFLFQRMVILDTEQRSMLDHTAEELSS